MLLSGALLQWREGLSERAYLSGAGSGVREVTEKRKKR
jgi:hypothetical protein